MSDFTPTDEQAHGLDIARKLAESGIPIFCARADPNGRTASGRATGFSLPEGWQTTSPNPRLVDAWRPGMALCMVTGNGLDVVDVDPRNGFGFASLNGSMPEAAGAATTPSGGFHMFVNSIGTRSMDDFAVGVDVKAGDGDGRGRGYVFVAPTAKPSKVDGEVRAYVWTRPPEMSEGDDSGAALRGLIEAKRAPNGAGNGDGEAKVIGPNYALAVLAGGIADVKTADNGARNKTLNAAAYAAGRCIPAFLDEATAREQLTRAARDAGLKDDEIENTLDSGLEAGKAEPHEASTGAPADDGFGFEVSPSVPSSPLDSARAKLAALDPQTRANLRVTPNEEIVAQGILTADELAAVDAPPGPPPGSGYTWDGVGGHWIHAIDGEVHVGPWQSFDGTWHNQPVVPAVDYSSQYFTVAELDELPQPSPLIDNVLDDHVLFSLVGPGRSYKSFLGWDWLACLASGKAWMGHDVERRKVLLVVGEGAYGLATRRDAWQTAWSTKLDPEWLHIRRSPVNLFKADAPYVDLLQRVRDEKYGVVLFDTLQRMTSGAERNSDKDAGLVVERMAALREVTDGSVGVVAHTGKNVEFGTRGSSAWEDDLDQVWRMKRDEDTGVVTATLGKRKDGPEDLAFDLIPQPVAGTGSLVLQLNNPMAMGTQPPKNVLPVMQLLAQSAVRDDGLSMSATAKALGYDGKGAVAPTFSWLQDEKYVQKVGSGRNTSWILTSSGLDRLSSVEGNAQ